MLLVEQNANIALELPDYAYLIETGCIVMGAPRPSSPATTPCAVPISAIEGEEMQGFLHQLLSGVADGGIYASLALALVMIYQATHHVNFAQGAMAMFSTFIAWAMIDAGFPYWAPFGLTLVSSFAADVAVEQIIIRLVERGPVLNIVIVFIGLLLILNSLAGWISSCTINSFPSPFPSGTWYGSKHMSSHEVGMIDVTLASSFQGDAERKKAECRGSTTLPSFRVFYMPCGLSGMFEKPTGQ